MTNRKLGLRQIRSLQPGQMAWDAVLPGFGARRQQGMAVTFFLKYRTKEGRQRWYSIGRFGAPWTPETARAEAYSLLAQVVRAADPAADKHAARKATTVAELCDEYLAEAEAGRLLTRRKTAKSASTLATDHGRVEAHIKPLLGGKVVAAVMQDDIEKFMHDVAAGKTARTAHSQKRSTTYVRGGRGAATRTMGLLGSIFAYAVRRRLRADNPVRGIVRFADGRRERRLSDEEYFTFGSGLRLAQESASIWPPAVAASKFLALTGWRSGEALSLRWDAVDFAKRTAILANTKTGRSIRPLSRLACDLLADLPRSAEFAFPAARGGHSLTGYPQIWARKIAPLGRLGHGVTPHTLRHSFASLASDLGFSEATIASLIGHKGRTTTSRYIHSADSVLLAAADMVAMETAKLMGDAHTSQIVPLHRARN